MLLVYHNVPELPGAFEGMGINELTRVIIPGSADIYFPDAGAYAVYYEYRGAIDGKSYFRDQQPPSMMCQLISKTTGEAIKLAPSNVKGNVYNTHDPERAGVMYKSISIDQPGVYTFSCQYPDDSMYPQIVLAVGPNIVLGFFNIAVKPVSAGLGGALAFMGTCGISLLIIVSVALKRHQSEINLIPQA